MPRKPEGQDSTGVCTPPLMNQNAARHTDTNERKKVTLRRRYPSIATTNVADVNPRRS